jgi:hypothetical protein
MSSDRCIARRRFATHPGLAVPEAAQAGEIIE